MDASKSWTLIYADAVVSTFTNDLPKSREIEGAKLTQPSADTALCDIYDLNGKGMLERQPGGGRSTSYGLTSID